MSLLRWLNRKNPNLPPPILASKNRRAFLRFDTLEDRVVPTVFPVTNIADSGGGSLRDAILNANTTPGPDIIIFATGAGQRIIALNSPLPALTDVVNIDATTQNGYNGVPLISLVGSNLATGDGFNIGNGAGGSSISGFVIRNFPGNGISLHADGNTIQGNYIGTNSAGTAPGPNAQNGIFIQDCSNNLIGGTAATAGNVISGNGNNGIALVGASSGTLIYGNKIGADAAGAGAIGNQFNGILVQGSTGNIIGSTVTGASNVIAFNGVDGVFVANGDTSLVNNSIFGNGTGVGVTGNGILSTQSGNTFINNGANPNGVDLGVDLSAQTLPVTATVSHGTGPGRVTLASSAPINTAPIVLDNSASLAIIGGSGSDTVLVDFANGNPVPANGLTFDGGNDANGASDTLLVQNGTLAAQTFSYNNTADGTIDLDDGLGASASIHYHRLGSVSSQIASPTVNLNVAAGAVARANLTDIAGGGNQLSATGVPTSAVLNFIHPNLAFNINVNSGTLLYNSDATIGDGKLTVFPGAKIGGSGNIGGPVDINDSGTISPGNSPGTVGTGDLSLKSGCTLDEEIDGTNPIDYDIIDVTGTVNINTNARLHVFLGYTPVNGDTFTIIDNDASDPIVGHFKDYNSPFAALNEGTTFAADGNLFRISYIGGSGNDVTLTVANPVVTTMAPVLGPTTGGTLVNIMGQNFTGTTLVSFGANPASFIVNSNTLITATAPPGSLGPTDVTVTKLGVSSSLTPADVFTYQVAPQFSSQVVNGGDMYAVDAFGQSPTALLGNNSVVEQLYVTFNVGVTLAPGAFRLDAGTVSVSIPSATPPSVPNIDAVGIIAEADAATLDTNGGFKSYRLRFTSNLAHGSSYLNIIDNTFAAGNISSTLKDGYYQLTTIGANVHAGNSVAGTPMAGNNIRGVWTLFGSVDAASFSPTTNNSNDNSSYATIGQPDLDALLATVGSSREFANPPYNANLDVDLSGDIGQVDLDAFIARLGSEWLF